MALTSSRGRLFVMVLIGFKLLVSIGKAQSFEKASTTSLETTTLSMGNDSYNSTTTSPTTAAPPTAATNNSKGYRYCSTKYDQWLEPCDDNCTKCDPGFKPCFSNKTEIWMCICDHCPAQYSSNLAVFIFMLVLVVLVASIVVMSARSYHHEKARTGRITPQFISQSDIKIEMEDRHLQCEPANSGSTAVLQGARREGVSSTPTLLKKILQGHELFISNFTRHLLLESTFQLLYIAIGYFDQEGGSLSLDKYNVHLYIPRGALPKGRLQQVYIYVNPNAPPVDGIHPPQVALSPVIQCGPPGLKFSDSVVLQFPHHASKNSSWRLRAEICDDVDATPNAWHPLDGEEDGIVVSTENKKVVLLMKHFTGAVLVGEPSTTSCKTVEVGAFGGPFTDADTSYAVRIHVWNDDPVAKQKVLDIEKELDSKLLDAYRDMLVHHSHGGVIVELENIKTGWALEENASQKQEISKSRVWQFQKNSVTFDLRRQLTSAESDLMQLLPGADGVIYQCISESDTTSTEDKIRLSIRPKQVKMATSLNEACNTCTKEKVRTAITKRVHGLMDGDYGGFSEKLVQKLCQQLDTEMDGHNWTELARDLLGEGLRSNDIARQESPAKETIKVYFAGCRADHRTDKLAVQHLIEKFASEIVDIVRNEVRRAWEESLPSGMQMSVTTGASGSVERVSDIPLRSAPGSNSDVSRLTPYQLSSEIDDQKRFRRLAEKLGPEWETLATELDCSSADLFRIKKDNPNCVVNQIFAMLVEWRQRGGRLDESILADALKKADRFDLAQQFQDETTKTALKEDEHVV